MVQRNSSEITNILTKQAREDAEFSFRVTLNQSSGGESFANHARPNSVGR
jgi:hypothetical protein